MTKRTRIGEAVRESVSKIVERPPVERITIYCTSCTKNYSANRKDNKGLLIKQQLCPHTILEEVKYNAA